METVGHIVKHVSGQLSDQAQGKEYIRWGIPTLLEYMKEALKEIATYRPEAFATTEEVSLVAGSMQKLSNNGLLEALTANTDGSPIVKTDSKLMKAFGAYATCAVSPRFKNGKPVYYVKSYAVDENDASIFYVSPPVPAGLNVKVQATYNKGASEPTLADWDKPLFIADKFYNNLIDYMMARAYQRDTESIVSQQQAQRLFQLFYQSMGAKYKIDSARGSGFYEGQIGTGDPRAVVR